MAGNSPDYNKSYYEQHREEILAKRRKKYMVDSGFAEGQRTRSRKNMRHRRKVEREQAQAAGSEKGLRRNRLLPRTYEVLINGKTEKVLMFHIGALANLLGRQTKTLHMWEREKVLPRAMFRDSANRRMYTEDQVNALKQAFEKTIAESHGHRWLGALRGAFHEAWAALPNGVKE